MARKSHATKITALETARDDAAAKLEAATEAMRSFYAAMAEFKLEDEDLDEAMNQLHDTQSALENLMGHVVKVADQKAPGRVRIPEATAALVAANID